MNSYAIIEHLRKITFFPKSFLEVFLLTNDQILETRLDELAHDLSSLACAAQTSKKIKMVEYITPEIGLEIDREKHYVCLFTSRENYHISKRPLWADQTKLAWVNNELVEYKYKGVITSEKFNTDPNFQKRFVTLDSLEIELVTAEVRQKLFAMTVNKCKQKRVGYESNVSSTPAVGSTMMENIAYPSVDPPPIRPPRKKRVEEPEKIGMTLDEVSESKSFDKKTELLIQEEISQKDKLKEELKVTAEPKEKKEKIIIMATETPEKTTKTQKSETVLAKVTRKASAARVIMARDAFEASKRLAVDEILSLTHEALANVLVASLPEDQRETVKGQLIKSLAAPEGAAFMALMVGGAMTMASDFVPEEYIEIYDEVAREFRVNSQVRVGRQLIEQLKPMLGQLFSGATQHLQSVAKAKSDLAAAEAIQVREMPSSAG